MDRALAAIACNAGVVNRSSIPDSENNVTYCDTSDDRGSVRILNNMDCVNGASAAAVGILPMNSGMNPYDCKSAGVTRS